VEANDACIWLMFDVAAVVVVLVPSGSVSWIFIESRLLETK
jgi:hypothetical protein